jgi:peptidyl-tRNA hydrolase
VPPLALHDYVLAPFAASEEADLASLTARGAEAIRCILKKGLAAAMNEFNKEGL